LCTQSGRGDENKNENFKNSTHSIGSLHSPEPFAGGCLEAVIVESVGRVR
jgi:hypothetical protein